jgi:hypothetical protein
MVEAQKKKEVTLSVQKSIKKAFHGSFKNLKGKSSKKHLDATPDFKELVPEFTKETMLI